jgi:hypothetical protein
MHKKIIVLLVIVLMSNNTSACDLCTVYLGIQPNDFKNSFSARHRYRLFERDFFSSGANNIDNKRRVLNTGISNKHTGIETEDIAVGESIRYKEAYNSYDLSANFYLGTKFQLNSTITFSDNYVYQDDSITNNVGGIGDLNLLLKYQIYNSIEKEDTTTKKRIIHRITSGFGLSLPTGNFNKASVIGFQTEFEANTLLGTPEMEMDAHLQPGTGSFGYLFLLEYLISYKGFGLNTNASYKLNGTNKNDFKFADRLNANGTLFYLFNVTNKIKIMPKTGLSYEYSERDTQNGEPFIGSGGDVLFVNYGLNMFINKIGLELTYYQPTKEYLKDVQPFNKRRLITQLNYYF